MSRFIAGHAETLDQLCGAGGKINSVQPIPLRWIQGPAARRIRGQQAAIRQENVRPQNLRIGFETVENFLCPVRLFKIHRHGGAHRDHLRIRLQKLLHARLRQGIAENNQAAAHDQKSQQSRAENCCHHALLDADRFKHGLFSNGSEAAVFNHLAGHFQQFPGNIQIRGVNMIQINQDLHRVAPAQLDHAAER